jgi:hypothetical protein
MVSPRKFLSNADLARLIESFFKYLTCCKVGLQFGSRLYFDMGATFERRVKPGVTVSGGSSSLVLEGYEWKIFDRKHNMVADSARVSDEIVVDKLEPLFLKANLEALKFDKGNKELRAQFSNRLLIVSAALLTGEYVDDNLCLWVLPDGRVLSCDAKRGFYSDGSLSLAHAKNYAPA